MLFRALGDGTFSDETGPAGLGELSQFVSWGTAFMDYDNDGWKDVFFVTDSGNRPLATEAFDAVRERVVAAIDAANGGA